MRVYLRLRRPQKRKPCTRTNRTNGIMNAAQISVCVWLMCVLCSSFFFVVVVVVVIVSEKREIQIKISILFGLCSSSEIAAPRWWPVSLRRFIIASIVRARSDASRSGAHPPPHIKRDHTTLAQSFCIRHATICLREVFMLCAPATSTRSSSQHSGDASINYVRTKATLSTLSSY